MKLLSSHVGRAIEKSDHQHEQDHGAAAARFGASSASPEQEQTQRQVHNLKWDAGNPDVDRKFWSLLSHQPVQQYRSGRYRTQHAQPVLVYGDADPFAAAADAQLR